MKHWFKEAPPVGYLGTWDSVIWHPVAVIIWSQHPVHQENNIHDPPDPHTSQSQQFPHCCASMTETESVHSQESQENRVDQGCHKVVPIVSSQNKYILVIKQTLSLFTYQQILINWLLTWCREIRLWWRFYSHNTLFPAALSTLYQ